MSTAEVGAKTPVMPLRESGLLQMRREFLYSQEFLYSPGDHQVQLRLELKSWTPHLKTRSPERLGSGWASDSLV